MPKADFFTKLGMFVISDFLDGGTCSQFIRDIGSAMQTPSTILNNYSDEESVSPNVRKTGSAEVSKSIVSLVHDRLSASRQDLENHFHINLEACETPQFLVYGEGDFFRPHVDGDDAPKKPDYVRKRKLSVVVFLNSEAAEQQSGDFEGGSLVFYGLIEDPRWKTYGFQLVGEAGLLIAFPSRIIHEVSPILRGQRYSIVSWFF